MTALHNVVYKAEPDATITTSRRRSGKVGPDAGQVGYKLGKKFVNLNLTYILNCQKFRPELDHFIKELIQPDLQWVVSS